MSTLAAISYTGGKDCTLALHRVKEQGIQVAVLVTFSPPLTDPKSFKAHALDIIKKQAESLGFDHTVCIIDGPDYLASYQREIKQLRTDYGIQLLVTGDILPVCSNFMERAVTDTGVELVRPLWQQPQQELLNEMWQRGFDILVTCINLEKIPQSVLDKVQGQFGVGMELTQTGLDLVGKEKSDISPTGEFGELHTMVLDCPLYKNRIKVESKVKQEDMFSFLVIESVQLA
ncbi:hypothetical protein MFLAVUS_001016 [Mucor flavus]|uniref:Diphthine--ammonia ligase n=1 Tax=Mucor flavus TaxID=439312 RepID=A0ABP9YLB5_9FUNG